MAALAQRFNVLHIPTQWHGHAALFTGTAIGSTSMIFIRLAQESGAPSIFIVAFRLVIATLILTPYVLTNHAPECRRLSRRLVLYSLAAGLFLGLHFLALAFSLEKNSVLIAGVLGLSSPIWVALLEVLFLKARFGAKVWFGLALAMSGGVSIALVKAKGVELGDNPLLGVALAVSAAIMAALYLTIGRKIRPYVSLFPYIWLLFASASVTAIIALIVTRTPVTGYTSDAYLWMLLLVLLPQLISHPLFNYALKHLSATYISVTGQTVIIVATILAYIVFHEVPSAMQIPGSVAIITGVVLVSIGQGHSNKSVHSEIETQER